MAAEKTDPLLAAGELDHTFAEGGIRNLFFPAPAGSRLSGPRSARSLPSSGMAIAVAKTSNIVVSATVRGGAGTSYGVARLQSNGDLDESFGSKGYITGQFLSGMPSQGRQINVYEQSEILLSGLVEKEAGRYDHAITRLLADGSPDQRFGAQGVVVVQMPVPELVGAVGGKTWFPPTDINNKIVFATSRNGIGVVWRLNSDGTPDKSFNGNGWVIVRLEGLRIDLSGVVELAGGRTVVYGQVLGTTQDGVLIAYNEAGQLDSGFGLNGVMRLNIKHGEERFDSRLNQLVIKPDGGLLVVGAAVDKNVSFPLMVGLTAEGHQDTGFNNGAPVVTDPGADPELSQWMGSDISRSEADASIFNVGVTLDQGDQRLLVGGFFANGQINPDFGGGTGWTASVPWSPTGMCLQRDNRMLVVGTKDSTARILRLLTER